MIRETPIGSSPLAHARYLHSAGTGCVTLAHKPGWQQHSYRLEKLYEVLPAYGGMDEVYISQNRFYDSRSNARLAELSTMYTDLDYYKRPELAEMHAAGVLDLALESLVREKIPRPSLAMATGRGLALVWRHEPVPCYTRAKWGRCQERIFEVLKDLGADPMAKSASQVLRLAGTYNSNSGALVESIWENLDDVWEFGELADEILPLTSEELEAQRAQRRAQRATRDAGRHPERQGADAKRFIPSHASGGPYARPTASARDTGKGQTAPRTARSVDVRRRGDAELPRRTPGIGEGDNRAGERICGLERGGD